MEDRRSPGCGRFGCDCPYCNSDNYDRYISDHLRQMLDEINFTLPEPVDINHDRIKGNEELYYKVINRKVLAMITQSEGTVESMNET